ncbi:MAG: hypothetical protein KF830_16260 [Planctomycetes bacterium]|nr:hypothetical protein [Planctomycetota bacterium]
MQAVDLGARGAGGPAADRGDEGERGLAIVLALLMTVLAVGITTTGVLMLRATVAKTRTNFAARTQAVSAARSGLAEALSWLRRQTSQPVTTFTPQLDASASPPQLDTIDPEIGLVREFRITGTTWARYEVWRPWPGDPDAARLARRQLWQVDDVSRPRAGASPGSVWKLRSVGYVYRRSSTAVPFDSPPNTVLASQIAEVEVRRLTITLPGQAAVNVRDGNSCHINTNGRIVGGTGAGIFYPQGTGSPTVGPASATRVTGTPSLAPSVTYDDSYQAVFGLSFAELSAMANRVVTSADDFPNPIPDSSIVIVDMPTLQINASRPLNGTGIVIVRGNLVMNAGNNSLFSGLLYVEGNLTVRAPSEINGSVICGGNMTVQGASDFATINFDEGVLDALLSRFGNYRLSSTTFLPRQSR